MSNLAQVIDHTTQPPLGEGYLAQRHELIPELLIVWAPCGCRWIGHDTGHGLLTVCLGKVCVYDWDEAKRAIETLLALEHPPQSKTGLEIVRWTGEGGA